MNTLSLVLLFGASTFAASGAASLPPADTRADVVRDLNTPRSFPMDLSRSGWTARARAVRENTLVSCGLWPLPPRNALAPRISEPTLHDGVNVHRVFFEPFAGYFLGGTLYTPVGVKPGQKLPAILNPHGHGKFGRLHDDDAYSNPARCIQFARMGWVAFSYDMTGYQDTFQFGAHRTFFLQPELQLWNFSLLGLQTWNNIRAVDFVSGLPFVDPKKIACTGESGGGTQTFMLGAVDDRLFAQAPICMVSHSMQGGCQCENAPGLRVEFSNMDIAAAPAPRRQLLVAATGDWTKKTMEVEGPAVAKAYALTGGAAKLNYEIHNFPHNYNQTSRESVYAWFHQWFEGTKERTRIPEQPHTALPEELVRVFPGAKQPKEALKEPEFLVARLNEAAGQFAQLTPKDAAGVEKLKRIQSVAWRANLQLEPAPKVVVERGAAGDRGAWRATPLAFGRPGRGDRVPALLLAPKSGKSSTLVVVAHAQGGAALLDAAGQPQGLAKQILEQGHAVLLPDLFLTGANARPELAAKRKPLEKFFTTYNRTDVQERVQDLVTACVVAKKELGARRVVLAGVGRAGLWTLLAAPAADAVAADCAGVTGSSDTELLAPDLFAPGLRKMGAFAGVAALAAPNPLLMHNAGTPYGAPVLTATYAVTKSSSKMRIEPGSVADASVAAWITAQFAR